MATKTKTKTKIKASKHDKGKSKDGGKGGSTLKKAFNAPRDSIYAMDPIVDLRICGGRGILPEEEAGDLDTEPSADMPVKDLRRLRDPLRPQFITEIDLESVRTPIIIVKIDGVAVVVAGKKRVRAARRSNRQRRKDGRPLMRVRCVIQRDSDERSILGTVIAENNARQDDDLADKLEKLKAFLKAGASEYDASIKFNVGLDRIRDWLAYDDDALRDTKKMVNTGEIPASTGMELAKIKDPAAQAAALQKILGGSGVKDRSARAARAIARGERDVPTATDRKSQKLLLAFVQDPGSAERLRGTSHQREFWRGVTETLKLVTGGQADGAVVEILRAARTRAGKGPDADASGGAPQAALLESSGDVAADRDDGRQVAS